MIQTLNCQRIGKMGLILWIDMNTFATGLLERAFKKKSLPFYTLDRVEGFSYLVDDLRPVLIVLDGDTFLKNPQAFLDQYDQSPVMQKTPFILLDPKSDFTFIKNKLAEIKRPIDPFAIPTLIEKLLKGN
jgi:hypothetical protein